MRTSVESGTSRQSNRSFQKRSRLNCRILHDLDFLGQNVNFTFKRDEVFTTNLGTTVSIISILLLGFVLLSRTIKLVEGADPIFAMVTSPYEDEQTIDLWDLNFKFAVEAVDPKIGRLEVFQVHTQDG